MGDLFMLGRAASFLCRVQVVYLVSHTKDVGAEEPAGLVDMMLSMKRVLLRFDVALPEVFRRKQPVLEIEVKVPCSDTFWKYPHSRGPNAGIYADNGI